MHLATLPSLSDVWKSLPHDHCPPVIHLAIRAWWALGNADTDAHLRILGVLVGLMLPAAYWFASRTTRRGVPLLAFALAGLNASVIATTDSFRGYGVAAASAVLMFALVWRAVERPTAGRLLMAATGAIFAVQCLYQNALFVLAACGSAAVVCAMRSRWRDATTMIGIGAVAAISMVPYIPIVSRAQDWYALEKSGFTLAGGWQMASAALNSSEAMFSVVWAALSVLAVVVAIVFAFRKRNTDQAGTGLALYSGVALAIGVVVFCAFLVFAQLPTQPWYYVPLMAFAAACIDSALAPTWKATRIALAICAVGITVIAWQQAVPALERRASNVDIIAERLNSQVRFGDYVVVHPWYCGATFARYYKGEAPWTTVPPLDDHYLHRYDLMKLEMQKHDAVQPVIDAIARTLQSGNRVFIVGWLPMDATPPASVQPAPNESWGWSDEGYSMAWGAQVAAFIRAHATGGDVVMNPAGAAVNDYENLPAIYVSGWR